MTENEKKILTFGGIAAAILFFMSDTKASSGAGSSKEQLKNGAFALLKRFLPLPRLETFSAKPFWDYAQWTWGYGTKVPGSVSNKNIRPTGTITSDKAFEEMERELNEVFLYIYPKVKVPLNVYQWASLISFGYNAGPGAAQKLLIEINKKDDPGLFAHMRQYKYGKVDGKAVLLSGLVFRREKEILLWKGEFKPW